MAELDEFSLIKRLFLPLTGGAAEALNLADDVALIAAGGGDDWAVTADAIVSGVHFLPDDPPELIARKLLRVNLSDIAAKGAQPRFALLTACFPKKTEQNWLDRFARGLKTDCAHYSLAVIGGDTVVTPGPLTLSLTALGLVERGRALLRSNARSGHNIWVSGSLGDAALGLLVARKEIAGLSSEHEAALLDRYRLPRPRVALGPRLLGLAAAAMDVSDGLMADLGHICEASGVGAVVEASLLPISAAARAALDAGMGEGIASIAAGGDDYEILFTAPAENDAAIAALSQELDLPLTRIGRVTAGPAVSLVDAAGAEIRLSRRGYEHFA